MELDQAILNEDYSPPSPSTDLSTRSPAQLAASSFLSDLDFLTRQRAYNEFLRRREVCRSMGDKGKHRQEPLFDLPLDFPIPTSLFCLPAAQLLLLQFNPACTSYTLVDAAGRLLFAAVEEAKNAFRDVEVVLEGYRLSREGGGKVMEVRCRLEWTSAGVRVVRENGGKIEFTIGAAEVRSAALVDNADNERSTLLLYAEQLSTLPSLSIASVNIRLTLIASTLTIRDEGALRRNIKFLEKRQKGPGFWTRQLAFIHALAPYADFSFPTFTSEDLRLLSGCSSLQSLPPLPFPTGIIPNAVHHSTPERLVLEHIYKGSERSLSLEESRTVLLSSLYPNLAAYARVLAKIVHARDCVISGYSVLLDQYLYPRSRDPTTVDAVMETIPIVEELAKARTGDACALFPLPSHQSSLDSLRPLSANLSSTQSQNTLSKNSDTVAQRPRFGLLEIGKGPLRRFGQALEKIAQHEAEVMREV